MSVSVLAVKGWWLHPTQALTLPQALCAPRNPCCHYHLSFSFPSYLLHFSIAMSLALCSPHHFHYHSNTQQTSWQPNQGRVYCTVCEVSKSPLWFSLILSFKYSTVSLFFTVHTNWWAFLLEVMKRESCSLYCIFLSAK